MNVISSLLLKGKINPRDVIDAWASDIIKIVHLAIKFIIVGLEKRKMNCMIKKMFWSV